MPGASRRSLRAINPASRTATASPMPIPAAMGAAAARHRPESRTATRVIPTARAAAATAPPRKTACGGGPTAASPNIPASPTPTAARTGTRQITGAAAATAATPTRPSPTGATATRYAAASDRPGGGSAPCRARGRRRACRSSPKRMTLPNSERVMFISNTSIRSRSLFLPFSAVDSATIVAFSPTRAFDGEEHSSRGAGPRNIPPPRHGAVHASRLRPARQRCAERSRYCRRTCHDFRDVAAFVAPAGISRVKRIRFPSSRLPASLGRLAEVDHYRIAQFRRNCLVFYSNAMRVSAGEHIAGAKIRPCHVQRKRRAEHAWSSTACPEA